jgi:hypothetical protein
MLSVIRNLRSIADHCRSGRPLPPELTRWLGDALDAFLEHTAPTVDSALGLQFAKGGVPWWREEGMRIRDAALRDMADRFCAEKSVSAQAAFIRRLAQHYAATCWPYDRRYREMPPYYLGTTKQLLWLAFKSGASMPLGERRLRSILVSRGERRQNGRRVNGFASAPPSECSVDESTADRI